MLGVAVVALIARTPRASALSATGDLQGAHAVSCPAHRVVLTPKAVQGAVDTFQTEPGDLPVVATGVIDRDHILLLRGWASDMPPRHAVAAVCLLVDGKIYAPQIDAYGAGRGDVAAVFNQPGVAASGYEIRADASSLTPGGHEITVIGVDAHGRIGAIAPPTRITIR
ncbi:MAG: hypothetical protein NVS4B13_11920 [Candidatus Elarobacter sp.]